MPELPEVETIKEALRKSVDGALIEKVTVYNRRFRESVADDFEEKLSGAVILRLYRIAKYVVIDLNNGFSIIWHFGMSGRVKIFKEAPVSLDKHDHIVIETSKGVLIYNDARRFGLMTHAKTAELSKHPLFGHIGVDPFSEDFCDEYLIKKLKNKKTPIKIFLLDQSIVCGIGNIYASEALYEAGISPLRESGSLKHAEAKKLVYAIKDTLAKAIAAGGSTLKDYRKPDGSTGYFQNQHCVYNKTGERCPNCNCDISKTGGIKKIVLGGRSTFYCANLQK